jgi:hypothetical protein
MHPGRIEESTTNSKPCGLGPSKFSEIIPNNTYRLQNLEGNEIFGGPVNGHFLKKFFV